MERVRLEFPAADGVHRDTFRVRIGDINYGRHLGHDAIVTLLHEARARALAALGVDEADTDGSPSVVADLTVQYRGEARWGDELLAETAVPEADGKGLPVYHRLTRVGDSRLVAVARVTLIWLAPDDGRPVAIPSSLQAALARVRSQGVD
ncbi:MULTISPECIES: thioesterase family protein [Modicisalibacter]|uniref:acyl-CoA thioesterase n=1 Tax=Modicisalibacter TaxID=574347 RepID=UPI00100AF5D3|nr:MULTISPECIES: thioesterase family protein [Halomonadaceae]MBZ9559322.1 thioesterase family protein [Modicisalibacter sp. R2A 31.J]MBZ9576513.1 thioesterase family protein [Modicisalibacter sp. MOD 31.J]